MRFDILLDAVGDEPVFETGTLLAGPVDPADLRRQLGRWTKAGKIVQLRRGLYALAPPWRKREAHPFLIANRLVTASYVSCQSALAHHGMIPEAVPVTVSVTSGRPGRRQTPLGVYEYRRVQTRLLWGYRLEAVSADGQQAFVASPEKALLDLVYLAPGGDDPAYLRELRLQALERLDLALLDQAVRRFDRPRIARAGRLLAALVGEQDEPYEELGA